MATHSSVFAWRIPGTGEREPRWPLELLRGSQAPRRAVCGTRGSLRTMHGGGSAPSCCAFTHRSSVIPFFCLQSFPASRSFPMSQFFASGGQSIGASASVLPMNVQDLLPLGWTGLISLVQGTLKSLFQHHSSEVSILWCSAFFMVPTLISIHDYWKNHSFDYTDLCQ